MKNEASFNEAMGQTIVFKSAEELTRNSETEPAPVVPQAQGRTFEEIKLGGVVEYRASYKETIPETVTTEQVLADNRRRWSQFDPDNPDNRTL